MRKYIILIVISLSSIVYLNAQTKFGVKGGVNLSNLAVEQDQIDDTKTKTGFTVGIFNQSQLLRIDWLMLKSELLYTVKGSKYEIGNTKVNANLQYLDVPLSVVVRIFNSPLTVHAGAQYSFLTKVKYEYESPLFADDTVVDDDRDNYTKWDLGVHAGLGLDFENLTIEGRFVRGLRNVEQDRTILSENFQSNDTKNFGFQITAGLKF